LVVQDLRFATRLLWRDKAYALTVVATLALCVGANTAIFAVVDSILLRPLAIHESDRVVIIYNSYPRAGAVYGATAVPDYFDRRRETTAFEEQALYIQRGVTLGMPGAAERVVGMDVTPSFFSLVRATPYRGRFFSDAEGEPGNQRKVVLTHGWWQQQFGGDESIVGREVRLDGEPHTVVGILPDTFRFLSPDTRLYRPLAFTPEQKSDEARHSNNWTMIARLKPGAAVARAQAEIDALNARNLERFPQYKDLLVNAGFHTVVKRFQDQLVEDVRGTLYLLWAGVAFLLVIGLVNITNLVLVRSTARMKELAMRRTLGAGLGSLARQMLVEMSVLTLIAAALGVLIAFSALGLLSAAALEQIPRGYDIRIGGRTIGFAVVLALGVGALIGALPLASLRTVNLSQAVREEGRGGTAGPRARLVRRLLVTSQVALAFMLLAGAGLLVASFGRVLAVDPGFEPDGVITGMVSPPQARYKEDAELRTFATRVLERVRAIPGVTHAALADSIPFGQDFSANGIFAEGRVMEPGESILAPNALVVTPGYFETLRISLAAGRYFSDADIDQSMPVAIVDEKLARKFWPRTDAVGKRIFLPTDMETLGKVTDKTRFITVVGVVRTVELFGPAAPRESVGAYYFPFAQSPRRGLTLVMRTAGDPASITPAVRREIASIDPELPFHGIKTMNQRLDDTLVNRRTPMVMAVFFGSVALFLAAVGIYGVLAYQVSQRRREIGIRIALGSEPRRIFRLILNEGAVLVAIGFATGLAGAVAVRGILQAQLYGIGALDPMVLGLVTVTLGLVALLACAIPARRAARVDPLIALSDT
jgi:predicted permease